MIKTPIRVEVAIEKRIITGMIVSTEYMQELHPLLNFNFFKNKFTRTVAKWCKIYFEKYNKAPFKHIEDIFRRYQDVGLDPDVADLIARLLTEISQRYELDPKINVDYLLDRTIEHFTKRELEIRINNVQALLDKGNIDDAKEQMLLYDTPERIVSECVSPLDQKSVDEVFYRNKDEFFKFSGQLGQFLGDMYRGWLVGVTGPFKRGKTFFLMEFGVVGVLSGLSVMIFSLEMPHKDINERFYKRVTGFTKGKDFIFPCFDCLSNQDGSCGKPERINKVTLLNANGEKPNFDPSVTYKPCTWCRKNDPKSYEKETWFEKIQCPEFEKEGVIKYIESFKKHYGDRLRIRSYPRFSANVRDIERDLNILEQHEGFVPDIIVVDYADILKPERSDLKGVEKEDETWMSLSKLAGERHALVVTGTQATRQALDVYQIRQKHTARWIGKLGHVDVMLSLNQTDDEKKDGILRIGIMEHRHKFFMEDEDVSILQKLSTAQVHLDSQI